MESKTCKVRHLSLSNRRVDAILTGLLKRRDLSGARHHSECARPDDAPYRSLKNKCFVDRERLILVAHLNSEGAGLQVFFQVKAYKGQVFQH